MVEKGASSVGKYSLYIVGWGERGEWIVDSKNVQNTPSAPTASAIGPCPTVIKIVGRPSTGRLPSTLYIITYKISNS